MEKQAKKYTVTLVAPIRHIMPGIAADQALSAATAAGKLAAEELAELYGKTLPPWFAIAETSLDPAWKPTLLVHDESAPDGAGDSLWQLQDNGKVVPAADRLSAALAFIEKFLGHYDKATLFSWDDQIMQRLRLDAMAILAATIPEPEKPAKRTRRKKTAAAA